ncbi:T9SS type A sorting domain-containing protein [Dyadobacter sp. 32]|uniref:T9SS type A sorting domain-containing protein n=1 Tax=Dyadobacter sp. 32 TaxID=538966 RepID=UPI0011EEE314
MKNFILLITLFVGAIGGTMPQANAQESVSETIAQVESLIARTRPGYYIQQFVIDLVANRDPCGDPRTCLLAPLPVELLYFTGARLDEENVLLKWETTSEVNNDYFEVERTLNPALGYETVGTVKGHGNASSNVQYQWPDPNTFGTYTYYRLKQVDFDGTFAYSTIIAVRGGAGPLAVTAFPNPGQARHIRFKMTGLRQATGAMATVYDIQGRIIYQNPDLKVSPEENVTLNLPQVSAGTYTLRLAIGDRETVSTFVLVP